MKRKVRQTVHMNAGSNNSRKSFLFERLVLKIKTSAQKEMTNEKNQRNLKKNQVRKEQRKTNKRTSEQRSILK